MGGVEFGAFLCENERLEKEYEEDRNLIYEANRELNLAHKSKRANTKIAHLEKARSALNKYCDMYPIR